MYKFKEIKRIHLELSTNCQAKCPMCARNIHGGLQNPNLIIADLDLEFIKKTLPYDLLNQLYEISVCGNFGDALLNKDLLKIVKYIKESNPNLRFVLHTNGSLRSTAWWTEFANALPNDHQIHFGIDGLEDTHHLYRIGTKWKKIIDNAKAFINAGGKARWNFITFKHNEHQLETCRQMAKDLGFESFHEKQTSRFIGTPYFDVVDKTGEVIYKLENPSERKITFITADTVKDFKKIVDMSNIQCEVESSMSIYIDGMGYLYPCCFVAGLPYHHTTSELLVHDYRLENLRVLNNLFDSFGGKEQLNLRKRSIREIIDSDQWQTLWDNSFTGEKIPVCARTCGKFDKPILSQCRDQFLDLSNFNE